MANATITVGACGKLKWRPGEHGQLDCGLGDDDRYGIPHRVSEKRGDHLHSETSDLIVNRICESDRNCVVRLIVVEENSQNE